MIPLLPLWACCSILCAPRHASVGPLCSKLSRACPIRMMTLADGFADVRFSFAYPTPVHIRHEWVLDIRPDEKDILAGMKEKWRYNIRLAGRKGVDGTQGRGTGRSRRVLPHLHTTSERDQFFIHNKAHYEDVLRLYGDRTTGRLSSWRNTRAKPSRASLCCAYGRWSWYMYGASSNEQRNLMPNHLLQWNGMQWAKVTRLLVL